MVLLLLFFVYSDAFYVALDEHTPECFFEDMTEEYAVLEIRYTCTPEPCVLEISDETNLFTQTEEEKSDNVVRFQPPIVATYALCFKARNTSELYLKTRLVKNYE
jgi:hypothetical protein